MSDKSGLLSEAFKPLQGSETLFDRILFQLDLYLNYHLGQYHKNEGRIDQTSCVPSDPSYKGSCRPSSIHINLPRDFLHLD